MSRPILTFDTEDDSKGRVQLLNLYDGKKHETLYLPEAMRHYLRDLRPKGLIWAVNLEYDAINLFKDDFGEFPRQIWFGKSKLISFMYKGHLFYDTLNHWKISVEEMTRIVGGTKEKLDVNDIRALTRRCRSDCEITHKFVSEMMKRYGMLEAKVKSTLPSTSLELYKSEFSRLKFQGVDTADTDFIKSSYCGGRTECFFIGTMFAPKDSPKRIFYVDINSMYPSVMLYDFPQPFVYDATPDLDRLGVTEATVKSDLPIPVLPLRREGKLIFPNGVFRGVWTNAELNYAVECGVRVLKIHRGISFPYTIKPFEDFVTTLYEKRKRSDDELMRQTFKLFMNSLYGKFGQGKERKKVIPYEKYLENPDKFKAESMKGAFLFDDKLLIYTEVADEYPKNTVMVWASYVTAYARIKLHRLIMSIQDGGGIPLYCDTDSVMFYGARELVQDSKELGAFKIEHELDGVNIKLPKFYRAWRQDEIVIERAKGVPRRVQREFFENNQATFDKPNKLFESFRRGLSPNKWEKTTKKLRGVYTKGVVKADGFITPLTLKLDN